MTGRIFLLDGDNLRPMDEQPYDSEDLLQRLLAEYPDLLAGDQIDDTDPRRWLLVQREAGVPDRDDGYNRWSVDHLFLDQDGIPTLVEVKRSSDTRWRSTVVPVDPAVETARFPEGLCCSQRHVQGDD